MSRIWGSHDRRTDPKFFFIRLLHLLSRGHPNRPKVSYRTGWNNPILNCVFLLVWTTICSRLNRVLKADGYDFCVGRSDGDLSVGRPVPVVCGGCSGLLQVHTSLLYHPALSRTFTPLLFRASRHLRTRGSWLHCSRSHSPSLPLSPAASLLRSSPLPFSCSMRLPQLPSPLQSFVPGPIKHSLSQICAPVPLQFSPSLLPSHSLTLHGRLPLTPLQ